MTTGRCVQFLHGLCKLGEKDGDLVNIYKQRYECVLDEKEGGLGSLNNMVSQRYNAVLVEVLGLIERMSKEHFAANDKDQTVFRVNNLFFMLNSLP